MKEIFEWFVGLFDTSQTWIPLMKDATNKLFVTNGLTSVIEIFVPVGILMAMVHISKEFLEKTSLQNIDLEQILKMFMKLILTFALINNVSSLIVGMNDFSNALYDSFSTAISFSESTVRDQGENITDDMSLPSADIDDITDAFDCGHTSDDEHTEDCANTKGNQTDLIAAFFSVVITIFGDFFYVIVIIFQSYSRAINIGYKAVYAPIAMSNITGYSTRNSAIQYAKELLALFMQLPIAYLGLAFTTKLIWHASSYGISGVAIPIIYIIGGIWVARSGSISKEMFT